MYYNCKTYEKILIGLFVIGVILGLIFFFIGDIGNIDIREGFTSLKNNFIPWPADLIHRFNIYQSTVGQNDYQYNMRILQEQATASEAEQLLNTGRWPWSDDIKQKYKDAISRSPVISVDPGEALDNVMKIYNQNAIKQVLAFNTKEGKFLINGTISNTNNNNNNDDSNDDNEKFGVFNASALNPTTIRCSDDLHSSVLQKKVFNGYNFWNGYKNTTTTTIKNEDIPSEVNGFSFVNGPCNPCDKQYNCPFRIDVNDRTGDKITPIWAELWHL
jgi:hypothetical protein